MKHQGGAAILRELQRLGPPRGGGGPASLYGGGALDRQQRASHGLPVVPGAGLAHRFGDGGVGLQDGGRSAPQAGGHALARIWHRHGLPFTCSIQERKRAMASLLGTTGELAFNFLPTKYTLTQVKETYRR